MVNLALEQGVFQSVLSVDPFFLWQFKDFIVVVNNAATGITDFAPTQIPAIFQFVNRTSHTVGAISAPGCQPFQPNAGKRKRSISRLSGNAAFRQGSLL